MCIIDQLDLVLIGSQLQMSWFGSLLRINVSTVSSTTLASSFLSYIYLLSISSAKLISCMHRKLYMRPGSGGFIKHLFFDTNKYIIHETLYAFFLKQFYTYVLQINIFLCLISIIYIIVGNSLRPYVIE